MVDGNNVLHFVTTLQESLNLSNGDIDSLAFSATYHYDYVNYHPIIWDFMTDGTCWKTMMVDSIISAPCSSSSTDTTNAKSPMAGASILGVSSHITVSRSADGKMVFYGWADSDPGTTGLPYNVAPDIKMKAYSIASGMVSNTKITTSSSNCCISSVTSCSGLPARISFCLYFAVHARRD